jgi:GNAT superfamily N-acetyltransferase
MITLRHLEPGQPLPATGLSTLLIDAVHGGASVGFLAPLSAETAAAYWNEVAAALGPALMLWVAEDGGEVVGSVQLALAQKENGRHRAEVCKLFVRRSHRGRGVATRLMQALEAAAQEAGRTLLVLDTQAGSEAEAVYRHLGWQRAGEIPEYAASPDAALHATALYFKVLRRE